MGTPAEAEHGRGDVRIVAPRRGPRDPRARSPALVPRRRVHHEARGHLLAARRLATIAGAGSVDNLFEPDLCLHSRVVGGSQLIPIRLAERLGDRVVLTRPSARALVRRPREVEAGGVTRRAASAIFAVPPNLAGADPLGPLAPRVADAPGAGISQGSVIKVLAVYDEPFWRADGLSGEGFAPYQLVREVYDNTPPAGGQACSARSSPARTRAAERLPPAERRRRVLEGSPLLRPARARRGRRDRAELVGRGVDARRLRGDVRDRRALALRPGPPAARRADPLGVHRPRRRRAHAHGGRDPLRAAAAAPSSPPLTAGV